MPPGHFTSDSDLESVISLQDVDKWKPRRNSTGPKYYCGTKDCGANFKRLDHLDRHEYHHTGVKKHACTYEGCDKTYTIVTHLKRHLRTTHERIAPPAKDICCAVDGCEKLFQSEANMKRHVREVHENPKVYRCAHCSEKFTQKLKMRRHEITKHTGDYPFSCKKCSKGFYQEWQWQRHLPNCKIYPCPGCALQFEKWSLYLKHCKETQHARKYYKCEYCPQTYAKPGELQTHISTRHLDDGSSDAVRHKCTAEGCERSYAYERNLRQHMRTTHSGRRFECTEPACGRVFSSGQNLTKHRKRDHNSMDQVEECEQTRNSSTGAVPAATAAKKTKSKRKKRKDAGRPLISNLAKLSGLAVDREFDQLLRARDEQALQTAAASLTQETDETADCEVREEDACATKTVNAIAYVACEQKVECEELNSLMEIALQDE